MSIDVEDSIKGFVKALRNDEIVPFLRIYQSLVSSYFIFKKLIKTYNPDFLLVTGNLTILPKSIAEKTIVYVHFPSDLEYLQYRQKIILLKYGKDYTYNHIFSFLRISIIIMILISITLKKQQ